MEVGLDRRMPAARCTTWIRGGEGEGGRMWGGEGRRDGETREGEREGGRDTKVEEEVKGRRQRRIEGEREASETARVRSKVRIVNQKYAINGITDTTTMARGTTACYRALPFTT